VITRGGIAGGLKHALKQRKPKQGEVNLISSCFERIHPDIGNAVLAPMSLRRVKRWPGSTGTSIPVEIASLRSQ
jgi:hypothetical protein